MHIDDPNWEQYETRFRALAETLAEDLALHRGPQTELASARLHLFLYGDNGMGPSQELELLSFFEDHQDKLKGLEIRTGYWEDLALYLPDEAESQA